MSIKAIANDTTVQRNFIKHSCWFVRVRFENDDEEPSRVEKYRVFRPPLSSR
jgi:hypothetical protein